MRAGEIKRELESYGISTRAFLEKSELVEALKKARADGLEPIIVKKNETEGAATTASTTTSSSSTTGAASSASSSTSTASKDARPREVRLAEELERCGGLKSSELKKELRERGIDTRSLLEKKEFVRALAEAVVDGVEKKKPADEGEGYAEYADVEVLTDDAAGPRRKQSEQQQQRPSSSPFGGAGSPFGDMGGIGGMGGIADMLKNMGMGGGGGGASPFGGTNPFAGPVSGMGDAFGKAQQMMQNPKVREIVAKAQKSPSMMRKVQECMGNPAAFAKYQNDPEVSELLNELKKYM
jgi:small glutamine-rich tetratricopeptide repeat-containing protein alpha